MSAVISDDGVYRYRLDREWDSHLQQPGNGFKVAWIMLNPSTADAEKNDPTILRCIDFSKRWGYSGLTVVNLYALRATDPKELWKHPDPIGPQNDDYINQVLHEQDHWEGLVIAAWGNNAHPQRLYDIRRKELWYGIKCLGITKSGAPIHPLARGNMRVPDDREPQWYG